MATSHGFPLSLVVLFGATFAFMLLTAATDPEREFEDSRNFKVRFRTGKS